MLAETSRRLSPFWERDDRSLARVMEGQREKARETRGWCLAVGLGLRFDQVA